MWDITIHPLSGSSVLAGTRSFLQSMWDHHQIHPFQGLTHCLMSTPFGEQSPRWHIAQWLALIPFVTAQVPVYCYQILSSLGFSFLAFKVFKTYLPRKGFHTLINSVLFSSPTNVGYHTLTIPINHLSTPPFLINEHAKLGMSMRAIFVNDLNLFVQRPTMCFRFQKLLQF